jgi:voltage-gated potassium channel
MRRKIWEILDGSGLSGRLGRIFNVLILLLIFLNVIAVALETVESLLAEWKTAFFVFELGSVAVFSVEYLLRLWSCTVDRNYPGAIKGRLKWIFSPMAIVDLVAVLPFFLPMLIVIDMRFLRALRLLRFFRLLKVGRYARSLRVMRQVVMRRREELLITVFALTLCLMVSSSTIYYLEREAQPDKFSSIPQALWWSVATLSTVGYGDVYPVTAGGQFFAALVAIAGIGLFGLPAGILASGFMEVVEERKERKKRAREGPKPEPKANPADHGAGMSCPHCGKGIRLEASSAS